MARGFDRSKLYRTVVPLTSLSQVRSEAYDTPLGQKGLVEGHTELKRSVGITGSGRAFEHGSGRRDSSVICVVEAPLDVLAVERTGEYRGMFHVLHGVLSPIDNIGAEDIHIPELLARLAGGEVLEVIVATNSDIEGEATAAYLHRAIAPLGVRVTRPAQGLPFGGDLEYADELSLARAMSGRRSL